MITNTNIGEIIFDRVREWDVEKHIANNMPFSEIKDERLVIVPEKIIDDTYWLKCYVNVNWCVPDKEGESDGIRLGEVEGIMSEIHYGKGEYSNTYYKFKKDSVGIEEDKQMRCHFVNLRLLFNVLNVK